MNKKPYQSTDESHIEQPDIQKILEKHDLGRHDLIFVATQVARIEKISPKQALQKLEEDVENLEEYLVALKFKEAEGWQNPKNMLSLKMLLQCGAKGSLHSEWIFISLRYELVF